MVSPPAVGPQLDPVRTTCSRRPPLPGRIPAMRAESRRQDLQAVRGSPAGALRYGLRHSPARQQAQCRRAASSRDTAPCTLLLRADSASGLAKQLQHHYGAAAVPSPPALGVVTRGWGAASLRCAARERSRVDSGAPGATRRLVCRESFGRRGSLLGRMGRASQLLDWGSGHPRPAESHLPPSCRGGSGFSCGLDHKN